MATGPVLAGWFVTDVGAIVVEHLEQVSEFDWRSEVRHDRHRVPLSASCHISTGSDPRPQQTEDKGAPRLACSETRQTAPELMPSTGLGVKRSQVQIRSAGAA